MSQLDWSPLTEADLPRIASVAQACLDTDGGLPELATEERLRALMLTGHGIVGRDPVGEVVAAAALGWNAGQRSVCGLVDPSARGQGIGADLVAWARAEAGGRPLCVIAETVGPEAEALFAQLGLHLVFAEVVMRHDLTRIPVVRIPDGVVSLPFTDDTSTAFDHAYRRSFGEQPGYQSGQEEAWGAWLRGREGFLPEDSRVAVDRSGHVAGFVTISRHWIEEVGVVPEWRGRGLGAHLVARSLTAMRHRGEDACWLCVDVENPARALYERLGFVAYGRRARYEERP